MLHQYIKLCVCSVSVHNGSGMVRGCSMAGLTSDVRPLYFTTTSEPRTLRRMVENIGQGLEHSGEQ